MKLTEEVNFLINGLMETESTKENWYTNSYSRAM